MKIPRRQFMQMLAALPVVAALPLTKLLPETTRLIWASGAAESNLDVEVIPGGAIRVNWGSILRRNNLEWAQFSDGKGVTYVWRDGEWSDGTPEILLDITVEDS